MPSRYSFSVFPWLFLHPASSPDSSLRFRLFEFGPFRAVAREAIRSVTHLVLAAASTLFLRLRRPNPVCFRDPECFQCRVVFIQFAISYGSPPLVRFQPVADSRLGRIVRQIFPVHGLVLSWGENHLLQSVLVALGPTPLSGCRWFSQNVLRLPASERRGRTSAVRHSRCHVSSGARRLWPSCRPVPW